MEFKGLTNSEKYHLEEPPIAAGGEGKIYTISGMQDKVAKVYHHPEKIDQDKLRFMVKEAQGYYGQLINSAIAWPLDTLTDSNGIICGMVMKKCPSVTKLSEILPDKSIDWGKRVIIAWNLCEIVQDVEKMNQCIGDMNPSNFGVDLSSGKAYAFDADSFHFRAGNGKLFPCYVGIAEYYAPELQRQLTRGQDMHTLNPENTFSLQTDRFALAVLIFQLLFEGYHPFSARRLEQYGSSTVVHRQATNILNKECAYFNPRPGTGIPKDAPPLSIIPPAMQEMFRQAFLTENRPSATEWQGSLSDLLRQLKECSRHHYYYSSLSECPWCEKIAASAEPKTNSEKTAEKKNNAAGITNPFSSAGKAVTPAGPPPEQAKITEASKRKSARKYVVVLCIVWIVVLLLSPNEEGGSTFDYLIRQIESGSIVHLFALVGPYISVYFIFKGKPKIMRTIGCFAFGYLSMMIPLLTAMGLDQASGKNLMLSSDSGLSTFLLLVVVFSSFAFGIYSGIRCTEAAE